MPSPVASPTADAIETILDQHPIEGTFSTPAPHGREGHTCRCGTRHPFYDTTVFPTHNQHLADLIDTHFGVRQARAIVRVMEQHALGGSFVKPLPRREVDQCRCGTQHPPSFDGRWATHRRHLAERIAALLPAPQQRRVPASR